jgi:hypothetical protein
MLARVIPQRVISIFFAASAQDAKSGSYAPVTALANGFAALLAVRLCGGSSNENGSGESASGKLGCNDALALAADHELIGRYFRRGFRGHHTGFPGTPYGLLTTGRDLGSVSPWLD